MELPEGQFVAPNAPILYNTENGEGAELHFAGNFISTEGDAPSRKRTRQDMDPFQQYTLNEDQDFSFGLNESLGRELRNLYPPPLNCSYDQYPDMIFPESYGSSTALPIQELAQSYGTTVVEPGPPDYQLAAKEDEMLKNSPEFNNICAWKDKITQIKDEISEVRKAQEALLGDGESSAEDPQRLNERQRALLDSLDMGKQTLNGILRTTMLPASELTTLRWCLRQVRILCSELELFQNELSLNFPALDINSTESYVKLVIERQSFPRTVKQHPKTQKSYQVSQGEPVVVRLLTSPNCKVTSIGKVIAEVVFDEFASNQRGFEVLNSHQNMTRGEASFFDLRFPQGTRLKTVRLTFNVETEHSVPMPGKQRRAINAVVVSTPSEPFVVMTNENQWDVSALTLLKKDAFSDRKAIEWEYFANVLQVHYLKATRQNTESPERQLSKHDLMYIRSTLFNDAAIVTEEAVEIFWNWFGKILHKIRHQKSFREMWLRGFVYGFLNKQTAEALLSHEIVGASLIRFSEQCPGKIAIAYVKHEPDMRCNKVFHFLDKNDATTLPEFLDARTNFSSMLQVKLCFDYAHPIAGRFPKSDVLEGFLARRATGSAVSGYEDELS
mmetsp:Transcript_23404/g.58529  ORF Transcript_23404/g.58529 Transcript_23404/m.58529 type:complete len:613 (-) Transcript_23404:123-1961(-)